MAFQVLVTGVDELAGQQMMTEVKIERRLYDHSEAHVVIRWQETEGFQDRPAALLAAKCLNCPVEIVWRDNDLAETTPCFRGYVQHASAQRLPTLSALTLSCVSYTKRTDLVARFRAFQATTLHDIAQQIARAEPLIKIVTAADLHLPIALSLQHAETDFAYLSRMLHASGVPMAADDMTGHVLLGARGKEPATPFPDSDFGWSHITFSGALHALPSLVQSGAGATGIARTALGGFLGQLTRLAADYHATPVHPEMSETHAQTASQADTSGYRLHLDGAVLPHAPGDVVEVEGQQHLIHAVSITGHPQQATASQLFQLQPLTLPLAPGRKPPQWPSRALWAYVTDNEHDPLQQGRVQVQFEPEPLDPQPGAGRAWLHTLTPYGGGAGPGGARLLAGAAPDPRAHGYAAGFYSLPEVGERVLVEFLGHWDSEAVVVGSVRHGGVSPADSARDTKRWRTPSGNEIGLTTQGEGAAARDVVTVHARDHVVLQAVVDPAGERVSLQCGGSYVHLLNRGGAARVEVVSGGAMLLHAAGHLQIEGDSVLIKARGGAVRVSDWAGAGVIGTGAVVGAKTADKTPRKAKKPTPKPPGPPSSKFDCAMKFLGNAEGGYTVDQGGPTMYGILQKEYGPYVRKHHPNDPEWPDLTQHPEDMKRLTKEHALEIYQSKYWDRQCEDLPLPLAICRLDAKVQTSHKNDHSTAYIAKGLGLPDGAPWAQVKEAAQRATPAGITKAVDSYLQGRIEFYHWLGTVPGPKQAANRRSMQGWANRMGVPNPYAASAKKAQRSQEAYGDGLKQFTEKLDKHCPGCK